MAKFRMYYKATASSSIDVEADDENGAIDEADRLWSSPSPCFHCSQILDLSDWEPDEGAHGIVRLGDDGRPVR
jgi:hypothetical protein